MKKLILIFCCFLPLFGISLSAQIPTRPEPPRLVNDLAGLFTSQEQANLEDRLRIFNDTTSNQIVIITVNDLEGYDASQFAYEVGQQWGVGQTKFDNGVVVLIKPKIGTSYGEAFIATGYGLEGILPDATCAGIVNNEMIPYFRNNDYYEGVNAALNVIMPIVAGEYSYKDYNRANPAGLIIFGIFFLGIFILIIVVIMKGGNNDHMSSGGRSGDLWKAILLGNMMSGSGHSGGSGSWGGGGSFGGFGGGSFGGGGGGGRW